MSRPTPKKTDAELVETVLTSSRPQSREDAYRMLLRRYWKVVVVLLRSRLSSARDAEDVAQEAFLRAWRSLGRLENPELFLGWLLRIARNRATDYLRRRKSETSLDALGEASLEDARRFAGEPNEVERRLEREEEWELARGAIERLAEPYRTVVTLRYLNGLSNQEMAERLGEPEGTIRNRLFRAIRKLRSSMERRHAREKTSP